MRLDDDAQGAGELGAAPAGVPPVADEDPDAVSMPMAFAAVRAATPIDVDDIVRIQADTWAAAYATLVPATAIAGLRGPEARRAWVAAVDAGHLHVATEGTWTVGFIAAARAEPPAGSAARAPVGAATPPPVRTPPEPAVGIAGEPGVGTPPRPAVGTPPEPAERTPVQPAVGVPVERADGTRTRPGPVVPAWGEIAALLVEPRWGRRGHGGRLLASAADRLHATGALYGLAWVPETDEATRRFYARAGWEPDGAVRAFDTGHGTLREVRLTGSLDLKLV